MIEKLVAYTAALNRYDLDAVEQMFALDAVYVSSGIGGELKGRAAIMAAFRTYFHQHTDQMNYDEAITQLDALNLQSRWRLKSSTSSRTGNQKLSFSTVGQITRIEVSDD